MKVIFSIVMFLLIGSPLIKAQFNAKDSLVFEAYEDSINIFSDSLFNSPIEKTRKFASYSIIKLLKTALLKDNSYYYDFPNIKAISIVTTDDDAFRIFTWQLIFDNNTYKYFGALQLRSKTLSLIPLIDNSAMLDNDKLPTMITGNDNWIGALYYDIKKVKEGKDVYYTVFGYDGNNALSTKKIIDVITFEDDKIKLGAPIFQLPDGKTAARFIMEYKKGVSTSARFSAEYNKIVIDHLIPEQEGSEGLYYTYVPDGSYDGFEWKKGKWQYIDKLFDFKLEDGDFPTGH
ncbi:MAG: hypothetical protein R2730_03765 [Chitinophagales bacterium]